MRRPTETRRRLNGYSVKPPPMKRPRVEPMEKEKTLQMRKKHLAYVPTLYIMSAVKGRYTGPTCLNRSSIGTVFAQEQDCY